MLKEHFNVDASKLTLDEFKEMYTGNIILSRYRIDIEDAFKQLGGVIVKQKSKKKESFD